MKKYFITGMLTLIVGWVHAQNKEVIQATSGDNLSNKVSAQMQFLFSKFTDGYVYYVGQQKISGQLNYNMLLGEMQFIDPTGQILALGNVPNVAMVTIDNRTFYPFDNKDFVEELLSSNNIQLQVRRKGKMAQHTKKAGFGGVSSTSSVTSFSGIDSQSSNLSVTEDILITLDNFYYLVTPNSKKRVLIKNQKTFTKQFPKHEAEIQTFVKDHQTRFDNEDDLKALVNYCGGLVSTGSK